MTCKAHNQGDQMVCHRCGLVWDNNDTPPSCLTDRQVTETVSRVELVKIKEVLHEH